MSDQASLGSMFRSLLTVRTRAHARGLGFTTSRGWDGGGEGVVPLQRKMEARRVRDEGLWDSVRLKDIHPAREAAYGG